MQSHFPVRPMPVSTSSATSRMPRSSQKARRAGKKSPGGMTVPAQPWMGSSTKAATCPVVPSRMNWS
ncbi:MAG: hypothetical protein AMJ81_13815 [Phycisphaerae bacterium SM23_33]|nr:MAG: hypothetical protein AMJ81_13815 [Phycisphaerae bacterium SM23_33]